MNKILLALGGVLLFTGCMTNENLSKNFSSGRIGCPSEEITIINEKATTFGSSHTWVAECRGRYYICDYQPSMGTTCNEDKEYLKHHAN